MNTLYLRIVATLAIVAFAAACASTAPLISEEERCTRYGGIWRGGPGLCTHPGGGGGGM
jgi:hypothetical protein